MPIESRSAEDIPGRRLRTTALAPKDWLPLARVEPSLTQPLSINFIKQNKHNDWFLRFALELSKQDDQQGRMLAKLYLFLRDFMPDGLAGRWAHIRGEDVMRYLCSSTEVAISRHRVTKDAKTSFDELEQWMRRGTDWREALARSQKTAGAPGKRKNSWKAPGLHTPAGLLAVMVIAYPETRFKDRIGRLQINWMMDAPEAIEVRKGFWEGINAHNLYQCFSHKESRVAATEFLADYTTMLQNFSAYRKDIRGCLPPWAQSITLEETPTDIQGSYNGGGSGSTSSSSGDSSGSASDSGSGGGGGKTEATRDGGGTEGASISAPLDGPHDLASDEKLNSLCRVLGPDDNPATPKELEAWLAGRLSRDDTPVLQTWCEQWASRIEGAKNYQQQLVAQSIFHQSARRLEKLCHSEFVDLAAAYMLLDMGDSDFKPSTQGASSQNLPPRGSFAAMARMNRELLCYVEKTRDSDLVALTKKICARQTAFFYDLVKSDSLHKYTAEAMSLEELRTQILIRGFEDFLMDGILNETVDDSIEEGRSKLLDLLDDPACEGLELTRWQIRALLVPASDPNYHLTDWQLRVFRSKTRPNHTPSAQPDFSQHRPVAAGSPPAEHGAHDGLLRSLFRDLDQAITRAPTAPVRTPCPPTPVPLPTPPAPPHLAPIITPAKAALGPATDVCNLPDKASNQSPSTTVRETGNTPRPSAEPNAFAGKRKKRADSVSASNRCQKAPRLAELTKDDLAEELNAYKDELKAEWSAELNDLREKLVSNMASAKEGFQQPVVQAVSTLEADLKSVRTIVVEVQQEQGATRDMVGSVRGSINDFHAEFGTLRDTVDRLRAGQDAIRATQDAIRATQEDIMREQASAKVENSLGQKSMQEAVLEEIGLRLSPMFDDLKSMLEKPPPTAGQDGYLTIHCPVPPDLASKWDQKAYESVLLHAAWYYIVRYDSCDNAVSEDEETLAATLDKFPDPPQEHIITALEHAHMWAFKRPFPYDPE